jgi:hypothetical protein
VNPWIGSFATGRVRADKIDLMNRDINALLVAPPGAG